MNDTGKRFLLDPLTAREIEILRLIEAGCANREIAQKLTLSLETIKWYNRQIYSKLGVHNRTQAVACAKDAGLLGIPSKTPEHPTIAPRHNLPAQITSFIGRQQEITEIQRLLSDNRLLTLSGPPGTGKTRLALQVASNVLHHFEDGIYFVDLAPIRDPQFVPSTIAQVFDLGESGTGSLLENLKHYLGNKQLLLVLDNYEQIIETAPLVGDLLSAAPSLKALVTSRQVLQIYGEQEYLVPPLEVPDFDSMDDVSAFKGCEAVELFCQRAQAVKADFNLTEGNADAIAEICVRLDGLPLAIELAAARSKLLTAEMIRCKLESRLEILTGGARDLPSRLQTLRGTIDWSFALLDEGEKTLFTRLSVFQGGRTIEATEAICAPGLSIPVIEGLESLLNKSLLNQEEGLGGEPRFIMMETLHEYAREKLAESGDEKYIQRRHAVYFAKLAEQAEKGMLGVEQDYWFQRLRSEHDNLRTALAFTLENDEKKLGLKIVGALRDFWNYGGHVGEGLEWIKRTLEGAENTSPSQRAKALNTAGWLSFVQGDYVRGKQFNSQALELYQDLGDGVNLAWALLFLSSQYLGSPAEIKEGLALSEEALTLFRDQDNIYGVIRALNFMGELARLDGDYDRAGNAYDECLTLCRQSGDKLREAYQLANLGLVAQHRGNYKLAESRFKEALTLSKNLNAKYPLALHLAGLSGPAGAFGNPERAAQLLGASDGLLKTMGLRQQPSDQPEIDRYEAAIRKQLDDDAFRSAWEKGQAMSLEQAIAFALEKGAEPK
jgi:predicted ATPase/DNA-binding CsgD family transcriptional regulator